MTGGVQAGLSSSEISRPPGCRPSFECGKAARCAAISQVAYRTRGVQEPGHVHKRLRTEAGRSRKRSAVSRSRSGRRRHAPQCRLERIWPESGAWCGYPACGGLWEVGNRRFSFDREYIRVGQCPAERKRLNAFLVLVAALLLVGRLAVDPAAGLDVSATGRR